MTSKTTRYIYTRLHHLVQVRDHAIRRTLPPHNCPKMKPDLDVEHVESREKVEVAVAEPSKSSESRDYDDSIEQTKISRNAWFITLTVATGGFLFGYDTGVISAVLVTLKADLGHTLSANEQELVTSLTPGGANIGAIIAGLTADNLIQASAFSLEQMGVGRFVVGLGVGSAAMIIPLCIGEIAPARHRGIMVALNNMTLSIGQLLSYALGAAFTSPANGWRCMIAIGGVPPIILVALLPRCPESPRQLLLHHKREDAARVIADTYPEATEEQLNAKVEHILWTLETRKALIDGRSLWWQFKHLHTVGTNRRPLISACVIMAVSQLGGFNTLMYYSATLFILVGFNNATSVAIVVGATSFVFNGVSMYVIERVGRRMILLVTSLGMCLSLLLISVAFHYIPITSNLQPIGGVNWGGIVVLPGIIIYIGFFSGGFASVSWVSTELLPLEVRALGTMSNTITCWASNIVLSSTFLSLMKSITPSGAFGIYSGICFLGFIFTIFCHPEVRGLPLEDVHQVYEHGFGIKVANRLQREAKLKRNTGLDRCLG